MLKILEKHKIGKRYFYKLSENMLEIVKDAQLYNTDKILLRQNPKIHLKRSRTGEGRHSKAVFKIKLKK